MKEKKTNSGLFILLGIFLILAYQGILPVIFAIIFQNLLKSENIIISSITTIGYYLFVLSLLILIFHKSLKKEWIAFTKDPKLYLKTGLSSWLKGLLTLMMFNIIITNFTNGIAGNEELNRQMLTATPISSIILMCVLGPVIEELIFRKSFRKAFKNKYTFALVTSFIFASLHVLNGFETLTLANMATNWTQFLFLLPYGSLAFFFALGYFETDNILTSTIAHCLHNTLSVLIILLIL